MRKQIMVLALLALVMFTATSGAWAITPYVTVTVDSREKVVVTGAAPQAQFYYMGQPIYQWAASMSEFLKNVPTGLNVEADFYPNLDAATLAVDGVYLSFQELSGKLDIDDKGNANIANVYRCQRGLDGRYLVRIPFDRFPGPQCLRFYALIRDGRRKEYRFLIINWATKSDVTQLTTRIEYTTSPWPSECAKPSAVELSNAMDKAGVGGSGLVYGGIAGTATADSQGSTYYVPGRMLVPQQSPHQSHQPQYQFQQSQQQTQQKIDPNIVAVGQAVVKVHEDVLILASGVNQLSANQQILAGKLNEVAGVVGQLQQDVAELKAGGSSITPCLPCSFTICVNVSGIWFYQIKDNRGASEAKGPYDVRKGQNGIKFTSDPGEGYVEVNVYDQSKKCWLGWQRFECIPGRTSVDYTGGVR